MEARRTFQGGASASRIWIGVAVLLAAMLLILAAAYAGKGVTSVSAPATVHVVQPAFAPDAKERNQILSNRYAPAQYAPTHKHPTVF